MGKKLGLWSDPVFLRGIRDGLAIVAVILFLAYLGVLIGR